MTVATNKQLGLVAAILTVLGSLYSILNIAGSFTSFSVISNLGFGGGLLLAFLGLIGFILFLVAMHGFSKDYSDPAIFNNILYGIISIIVIGVIAVGIVLFFVFSNMSNFAQLPGTPSASTEFLQYFVGMLIPVLVVFTILAIVPAVFNMRAFNRLADKSGVRLFKTVGLLGVVAAAFTIALGFLAAALFYMGVLTVNNFYTVPAIGAVVSLAAWILAAKAFSSITEPTSETSWTPAAQTPTPPIAQVKYCPYCGAANTMDAEYCVRCGKKQ